ncbi:MAG: SCO family protein [Alphaproteobacteria bacterium]|nr:SCO family protein [Alphaproteobacteria bacterium]
MYRDAHSMIRVMGLLFLGAAVALPSAVVAQEHDASASHEHESKGGPESLKVNVTLLDSELLDQDGNPVRFASEAVADRIVVMNFVYTSCATVCPVSSALMVQIQADLQGAENSEVQLLTISVDPAKDTPDRLKDYATSIGAAPGWLWLTGYKPTVDEVLKGLGVYTANYDDHPPVMLIGDSRSADWRRLYGFPDPEQVVARVKELQQARNATH